VEYLIFGLLAVVLVLAYALLPRFTSLRFDPVVGTTFVELAAAALLVLILLSPSVRRTTPRRQATLLLLRLAVLVVLLLIMLRPTFVHTVHQQKKGTLAFLIDRSRSMALTDEGEASRWDRLRAALDEALPEINRLAQSLEIKFYAFGQELDPLRYEEGRLDLDAVPDEEQSAHGFALEQLRRLLAGSRVVGIVLLSDGHWQASPPRDRKPELEARRLRDDGTPLFPVVFGRTDAQGQVRDVAVEQLLVPAGVHEKNQLAIAATARIHGYLNQNIPVQLLFETTPGTMEVVATTQIRATHEGESVPIELTYVPQTAGEYKLTLRLVPRDGELVTINNEQSTFISVHAGGINVLFLQGRLSPEARFLKRSLDASPNLQVDYVRLDHRHSTQRSDEVARLLQEAFQPGRYKVYIIGDLDRDAFDAAGTELAALRKAIGAGAGFLMLGGFHSFGPGGYAATPLEEVLPVHMDPLDRQSFDEQLRLDHHIVQSVRMVPAPEAGRQYIMTLAGDEQRNRQIWDSLPPLSGANKLRVRDGVVIAQTPDGQPLLVAREVGGRVLAFAGDSTWRWCLHGFEEEHKRFWRQVVLYLARAEDLSGQGVLVRIDQRQVRVGGRVIVTATATSAQGEPLPQAEFDAYVLLPDGSRRPLSLVRLGAESQATFRETQLPGDYKVVATATHAGALVGTGAARFLVAQQDPELENPAPDLAAMELWAKASMAPGDPRARAYTPDEFPDVVAELQKLPKLLVERRETRVELWHHWSLNLALVVLLSLEWYLRKRWGMV
jgi:hypothetical protein